MQYWIVWDHLPGPIFVPTNGDPSGELTITAPMTYISTEVKQKHFENR